MRTFLKDNIILVLGITLPLIMMLLFGLATLLPRYFVEPPQYNILFSSGDYYYDYDNTGFRFNLVNGKLTGVFNNKKDNKNYYLSSRPRLLIFSPQSLEFKEIKLNLPLLKANTKAFTTAINVPELTHMNIDNSAKAPDGYVYQYRNYYSGSLINDIFFNANYRNYSSFIISKNGNNIPVPLPPETTGSYNNLKFIGWLIPEKGQ